MKLAVRNGLILAAAIVAFVLASEVPIWLTLAWDRRFLLKHVDRRAVATACLDLLTKPEYQPLIGQYPSANDPRLPPAIRAVKPFSVSVHSNLVMIFKTGGHYHMGYIFRPAESDSNQFELVFQQEGDAEHAIPLYSIRRK